MLELSRKRLTKKNRAESIAELPISARCPGQDAFGSIVWLPDTHVSEDPCLPIREGRSQGLANIRRLIACYKENGMDGKHAQTNRSGTVIPIHFVSLNSHSHAYTFSVLCSYPRNSTLQALPLGRTSPEVVPLLSLI